jgi:hypothetical protein
MKKPYIILCEQWKNEVWLCWWWTPKEYSEYIESQWVKDYLEPTWVWETTVMSTGWILIWVWKRDNIDMLLTLNHETFHACDYLLREKVWITLSKYSDETYAYTIDWIQRKLYEYIKLKISTI